VNVIALVIALAPALAGCRSDEELAGPDLSSASLYCPSDPPADNTFVCDATAIPYCTYPTQHVTCHCVMSLLTCGPEDPGPDAGLPTGTGT
jgi:hypothetical protein